ncbi:MAG: SEC-C metal-binding domain-containing protein [Nitrospiraceae bacterium]|nr:SEC-C metal-binding domain-containing protein [Nitrospiraceae bacterium]
MNQTPVGPYEPCPCGSGAKYKFCCRDKDRESKRAQAAPAEFTRERFDQLAEEAGIKEKLGELGAGVVFQMARRMRENQRTRKTRRLTQLETRVDPRIPAAAVDLSGAYQKPEPVRMRGGLLHRGDPITREWIARIAQDPAWQDGEKPQELIENTFLPLLADWERHLTGPLKFPGEEVSSWRPLLENFLLTYLVAYEGKLATDIGGKAHLIRQYLGNFYPRKFMDRNLESVYHALKGLASFYVYLYHLGLIDLDKAAGVVRVCEDHDFFRRRLEGYFRAEGDEMREWVSEWDYDATIIENENG